MSRLVSVAMTTDAVIERRKTVTRRKGGITEPITRIEWRYVCGSGFCECGGCVL